MKNLVIVVFVMSCISTGAAQTIEKYSIDSGGASATAGGIEILYTIGEVFIAERSASGVSISEGFINPEFKLQINAQVLLQGPILNPVDIGLMNDDLRTVGDLPTTSPYEDAATCDASVFNTTGNDAIVDWVWLSIRANNDNQKQIQGRSALLQRDGDIVDTDGFSDVTLNIPKNTYYIAIQHRNHLGAMSANPVQFDDTSTVIIDFKNSGFSTFGSNAQVALGSGETALWAGDANGDKAIQFSGGNSDANAVKDFILADPLNILNFITFSSSGYLSFDADLNTLTRFSGSNNDSNIIKDNVLAFPGNILGFPTYTINSTVPPTTN
ncbi:hemagglutinin protein [Winogradskyella sp.]|uniref:hemagglutinin protein n=1 Tax=Winogradskyella sp. TaxID=1883156 RepID=UPI003BA84513